MLEKNIAPTIHVDLRTSFPKIRDQGSRPLCLAFSASDVNSNVNSVSEALSVEYLAYHAYLYETHTDYNRGLSIHSITHALKNDGQPTENEHPYDYQATTPKIPLTNFSNLFHCMNDSTGLSVDDIFNQLNLGLPIILGINLSHSCFSPTYPYVIAEDGDNLGGHAVIAVGSGELDCGTRCILIRNSWGLAWGEKGHSWLTENYLSNRLITSLTLSK